MNKIALNTKGIIQMLIGLGGLASGLMFIIAPDGSLMGISTEVLIDTPFKDYLIPGILLLTFIGLSHIIAASLSFANNRFSHYLDIAIGFAMAIWIIVQLLMIGYESFLQPLILILAIIEILIGMFVCWKYKTAK
ncbi:hypothetical protein ACFLY3_01745 [Chloroflexota bacterium]